MNDTAIIICPDCGQRYDPAKAARVKRVQTGYGRTIKPGRIEAQDVRKAAHSRGRHHQAHWTTTQLALKGWAPIALDYRHDSLFDDARIAGIGTLYKLIDDTIQPGYARLEELPSFAIDLDGGTREFVERIVRAALAVREDHPWWCAYLCEFGASPSVVAFGITVGVANRGDLFFRQSASIPVIGQTLQGVL